MNAFLHSPVFGLGLNATTAFTGHAQHNSFLQAFVNMGLVGGTLFFGCFYYTLDVLHRLGPAAAETADLTLRHARPFVLAAVGAYAVGITSLNHCYTPPTFLILAVAMALIRLIRPRRPAAAFDAGPAPDLACVRRVAGFYYVSFYFY